VTKLRRTQSIEISFNTFVRLIEKLNYQYRHEIASDEYPLIRCCLYNKDKEQVATGYGKGIDDASRVIASYEALQHLLSNPKYFIPKILHSTYNELVNTHYLLKQHLLDELLTNKSSKEKKLTWLSFTNDQTHKPGVLPLIYTLPYDDIESTVEDEFDYEQVYSQASDNGIASGDNFQEALLFALLELLERDAVSKFLMNSIVGDEPILLLDIPLDFISKENTAMLTQLYNKHNLSLQIIYIPTKYDLYTVITILRNDNDALPYKGLKTSFDFYDTVEAAIEEAIQDFWIHQQYVERDYLCELLQSFENHPVLQRCLKLDFSDKTIQLYQIVPSCESKEQTATTLAPHLIAALYKDNKQIYYREIFKEEGYFLIQAIIPTLEEFATILFGNITLPQPQEN
jgi:ribosomal protein S12 methylthiotransferase accessory factor YcaO